MPSMFMASDYCFMAREMSGVCWRKSRLDPTEIFFRFLAEGRWRVVCGEVAWHSMQMEGLKTNTKSTIVIIGIMLSHNSSWSINELRQQRRQTDRRSERGDEYYHYKSSSDKTQVNYKNTNNHSLVYASTPRHPFSVLPSSVLGASATRPT